MEISMSLYACSIDVCLSPRNIWTITYPHGRAFNLCHEHLQKNPNYDQKCASGRFFNKETEFAYNKVTFKKITATWKKEENFICYKCHTTLDLWKFVTCVADN